MNYEELNNNIDLKNKLRAQDIIDVIYPIGSIYVNYENSSNPADIFGVGEWTPLNEGRVLIGCNDTYRAGVAGGEFTHSLTEAEMPPHTHSYQRNARSSRAESSGVRPAGYSVNSSVSNYTTTSTGSGTAFNLMQPYIPVYMWRRTR